MKKVFKTGPCTNQRGKDWCERLDYVEVINTNFGPWLRFITKDDLENVSPERFSLSVFAGKVRHKIPVTCFDDINGKIIYLRIIEPDTNGLPQRYLRKTDGTLEKIP